jgi:hypothetical protein
MGSRVQSGREADSLRAICEPIVLRMSSSRMLRRVALVRTSSRILRRVLLKEPTFRKNVAPPKRLFLQKHTA